MLKPLSKPLRILIYSLAALIVLFVAGVMVKSYLDHKRLMAEGTRGEGNVLELFEQKSTRRRSTSSTYYAKVGLFTKDKAAAA
ncbi:MAG: hypothetical protein JNG86_02810, partial [Verrucomicrobiaceae bacterium]|nr:hypothetical protein [Verrucomicrobiaceae bacterium]